MYKMNKEDKQKAIEAKQHQLEDTWRFTEILSERDKIVVELKDKLQEAITESASKGVSTIIKLLFIVWNSLYGRERREREEREDDDGDSDDDDDSDTGHDYWHKCHMEHYELGNDNEMNEWKESLQKSKFQTNLR